MGTYLDGPRIRDPAGRGDSGSRGIPPAGDPAPAGDSRIPAGFPGFDDTIDSGVSRWEFLK